MAIFNAKARGAFGAVRPWLLPMVLVAGSGSAGLAADLSSPMTQAHNVDRAQHGVAPLTWSADLAAGAQQWANACTPSGSGFAHSPSAFKTYGENLAWGTGLSASGAVALWYAEGKSYNYGNPLPAYNAGTVLHFTQLIWRGSQSLGCGVAVCGGQNLYVCRYSPPGNFNGQNPGVLASNVPPPAAAPPTPTPVTPPPPQPTPTPPTTTGGGAFSAFASDGRGRYGYSLFQAAAATAQSGAINGCGGAGIGCKAFYTSRDKCVSYAESRQGGYWFAAGSGTSQQVAAQNSVRFCQSGTAPPNSCRAVVTRCQ